MDTETNTNRTADRFQRLADCYASGLGRLNGSEWPEKQKEKLRRQFANKPEWIEASEEEVDRHIEEYKKSIDTILS